MTFWLPIVLAAIALGIFAFLLVRLWGRAALLACIWVPLSLLLLGSLSMSRFARPNQSAISTHVHAYLGISSPELMYAAYRDILDADTAKADDRREVDNTESYAPQVVLYGRPEMKQTFDKLKILMLNARFQAVEPDNDLELKEGLLLDAMLRDIKERVLEPGSGMAADSRVILYYPRDLSAQGLSIASKINQDATQESGVKPMIVSPPKLPRFFRLDPIDGRDFSFFLPDLNLLEFPSVVSPGTEVITTILQQSSKSNLPLKLEVLTQSPDTDDTGTVKNTVRDFVVTSGMGLIENHPSIVKSGRSMPCDLNQVFPPSSGLQKVTIQLTAPVSNQPRRQDQTTDPVASKTLIIKRQIALEGTGVTETVSTLQETATVGIVPAAFIRAHADERSTLYHGLYASNPSLVTALGLTLDPAQEDQDIKKLKDAYAGLIIADVANFQDAAGALHPGAPASFAQFKNLLGKLDAIPNLLFVGDFDSLVQGTLKRAVNSPRRVLVFVDTSFSVGVYAKDVKQIQSRISDSMNVRAFKEPAYITTTNPRDEESLRYELYAILNSNHAAIASVLNQDKAAVSDIISFYDSWNTGGSDNRWVEQPDGFPGQPPMHLSNGVVPRFNRAFPSPGPDLWLVCMEHRGESWPNHAAIVAANPDRIHPYPDHFTNANGRINEGIAGVSEWIQNKVMPRLDVSFGANARTVLSVNENNILALMNAVVMSGKAMLVNSFCDFKPRIDWATQLSGQSLVPILWTEHWHRGKLANDNDLASPFLVKLPMINLGGDRTTSAFQVCIELAANLAKDGSAEQRNKLGQVFMHIINCTSAFAASPDISVLLTREGVEFSQRGSKPFSGDKATFLQLVDAATGAPQTAWREDISRLDRPKIVLDRPDAVVVLDATIQPKGKPSFTFRFVTPDSALNVVPSEPALSASDTIKHEDVPGIPGWLLPYIAGALAVSLIVFIKSK